MEQHETENQKIEPAISSEDYRKAIAGDLSREENTRLRINDIKAKVKKTIMSGNPVIFTDEMTELGIRDEIYLMCRRHDMVLKLKALHDDSDEF